MCSATKLDRGHFVVVVVVVFLHAKLYHNVCSVAKIISHCQLNDNYARLKYAFVALI